MPGDKETYILDLNNKKYIQGMREADDETNTVEDSVDRLNKKVGDEKSGLGGRFSKLGKFVAVGAITAGIGAIGKKVINLGADMEQTRVAFGTFLGDTDKANKLINELNTFANVTPFNNEEVIKSGRLLLAAGIEAENITDNLKMIGDVAAGANVPITELSAIFQKATNKGKLQAEELNQFSERGIPILDELSKMYGVTKAEILDMGSKGKITSDVMNTAFENMTGEGGIFFNLMAKQSETLGGKFSTLQGSLQMLGIKIGEALIPVMTKLTDFAIKLTQNEKLLKRIVITVGIAVGVLTTFMLATKGITMAIQAWKVVQLALNIAMSANPIGAIIVGVMALTVFVFKLVDAWKAWGTTAESTTGIMGNIVTFLKTIVANVMTVVNAFKEGGFFKGLAAYGKLIMNKLLLPMQMFLKLLSKLPGKIGKFAEKASDGLEDFRKNQLGAVTFGDTRTKGEIMSIASGGKPTGKTEERKGLGERLGLFPTKDDLTLTKNGVKPGTSGVTASAPKTFNINIDSLIKEQNFETVKDMGQMSDIIRAEVSRILLSVVNDVQTS
jgi:tape measure domain-containing protein